MHKEFLAIIYVYVLLEICIVGISAINWVYNPIKCVGGPCGMGTCPANSSSLWKKRSCFGKSPPLEQAVHMQGCYQDRGSLVSGKRRFYLSQSLKSHFPLFRFLGCGVKNEGTLEKSPSLYPHSLSYVFRSFLRWYYFSH